MTSLFILLIYASGYWDLECLLVVFREYFTEPRSPSPFLILRVSHHFGRVGSDHAAGRPDGQNKTALILR